MSTPSMPDLRFLRKGTGTGTANQDIDFDEKKAHVPENKSCPIQLVMNLLFYQSYGFFARTGGNGYDRTDGRTSPKKFATYLKTKVSRLKKLVDKCRPRRCRTYGFCARFACSHTARPDPAGRATYPEKKRTYLKTKVVRFN